MLDGGGMSPLRTREGFEMGKEISLTRGDLELVDVVREVIEVSLHKAAMPDVGISDQEWGSLDIHVSELLTTFRAVIFINGSSPAFRIRGDLCFWNGHVRGNGKLCVHIFDPQATLFCRGVTGCFDHFSSSGRSISVIFTVYSTSCTP